MSLIFWWTWRDSNPRPYGCERIKSYDLYCFLAISGAFGWNVNGLVTSFARCNHVSRKCLWYALWSQEHKRKDVLPVRVYHSPKRRKRQRFSWLLAEQTVGCHNQRVRTDKIIMFCRICNECDIAADMKSILLLCGQNLRKYWTNGVSNPLVRFAK